MIRKTKGWNNATEEMAKIIKKYGSGHQNGILIALINVSAWVLYTQGYRAGDGLDWFKRAIEEQITELQNSEEMRPIHTL